MKQVITIPVTVTIEIPDSINIPGNSTSPMGSGGANPVPISPVTSASTIPPVDLTTDNALAGYWLRVGKSAGVDPNEVNFMVPGQWATIYNNVNNLPEGAAESDSKLWPGVLALYLSRPGQHPAKQLATSYPNRAALDAAIQGFRYGVKLDGEIILEDGFSPAHYEEFFTWPDSIRRTVPAGGEEVLV